MSNIITEIRVTDNVALITVNNLVGNVSHIPTIFSDIAEKGINVDMISLSPPYKSMINLSFTLCSDYIREAISTVALFKDKIPKINCDINANNAKITVYGCKMKDTAGVAADILSTVVNSGIEIKLITTSEEEVSILVSDTDVDNAYRVLKDKFLP